MYNQLEGYIMSKVLVFSKCPNDIEFRTYNHIKDANGSTVHSQVVDRCVVQGTTKYQYDHKQIFTFEGALAQTEVDKDLWDRIMAERGQADMLLSSKQVFAAKNEVEARAILREVGKSIFDMKTPEDLKKKKTEVRKMI